MGTPTNHIMCSKFINKYNIQYIQAIQVNYAQTYAMKYSVIPTISNIKNKFLTSLFLESKYRPEYFWSLVTLSIT